MHLWQALNYPFNVEQNRRIILYGILLICIPVFGWLIWYGYSVRLNRCLLLEETKRFPDVEIMHDFGRGIALVFANIVYQFILIILAFLGGLLLGYVFGPNQFVAGLYNFVLTILSFLFGCALTIGRIHAAANDEMGVLFHVLPNFNIARNAKFLFLQWWFLQLVLSLCAVLVFLNIQFIFLLLFGWMDGLLVWIAPILVTLLVIAMSIVLVLVSLSSIFLDAQLAEKLDIQAYKLYKEKQS